MSSNRSGWYQGQIVLQERSKYVYGHVQTKNIFTGYYHIYSLQICLVLLLVVVVVGCC